MFFSCESGAGVTAQTTEIRKVIPESLMSIYLRLLSHSGFSSSKSFPTTSIVAAKKKIKFKFLKQSCRGGQYSLKT